MPDVTLISHPKVPFAGARNLFTAQDGILLGVTRTNFHCAVRRLREEGFTIPEAGIGNILR
jgi:hypothetical protein